MKNRRIDEELERWRDVPGYAGRYQASDEGRVRRVNPDGSTKILKGFVRRRANSANRIYKPFAVWMVDPGGKVRIRSVISVVASTWLDVQPGQVAYHKNGMSQTNALWNIGLCTYQELGQKFGASRERACVKVRGREVLEYYRSAKVAAKANFCCYDSVLRRCNGEIKRPYLPDGTTFRWEDPMGKA